MVFLRFPDYIRIKALSFKTLQFFKPVEPPKVLSNYSTDVTMVLLVKVGNAAP